MVPYLMILDSTPNVFSKSWKPIDTKLRNLVQSATNGTGEFVEALTYSREIVSAKRGKPKWVLPSVRLITVGNSQGQNKADPQNEIDVVSIELLENYVQIKLIECTESPSPVKATKDHSKLEVLKGIIGSQRFQDLRVSTLVVSSSKVGKDFLSVDRL